MCFLASIFLHATKSSQDYGLVINPMKMGKTTNTEQNSSQIQSFIPHFFWSENLGTDLTLMALLEYFRNAILQGAQLICSILAKLCCWLHVAFVGANEFLMLPCIKLEKKN